MAVLALLRTDVGRVRELDLHGMPGVVNVLSQIIALLHFLRVTLEERVDRVFLVFALGRFVLRAEGDQLVTQLERLARLLAAVSAYHADITSFMADRDNQAVADLLGASGGLFLFVQAQDDLILREVLGTSPGFL